MVLEMGDLFWPDTETQNKKFLTPPTNIYTAYLIHYPSRMLHIIGKNASLMEFVGDMGTVMSLTETEALIYLSQVPQML